MTDFENAAFTVFVVLLSRIILYYDLNLYMPLSRVDENMQRAAKRDAVQREKFYFRQSVMPDGKLNACGQDRHSPPGSDANINSLSFDRASTPEPPPSPYSQPSFTPASRRHARVRKMHSEQFEYDKEARELFGQHFTGELTAHEILTGKNGFSGLVPMIMAYLSQIGTDSQTMKTVTVYMDFICARASGELLTNAAWMRNFVLSHPDYKQDSVVGPSIATDLMVQCHRIGQGLDAVPELYGGFAEHMTAVLAKDAYAAALGSKADKDSVSKLESLVQEHTKRIKLNARKRQLQAELVKVDEMLDNLAL